MNDEELKKAFKAMKFGEPSQLEVQRWKTVVRRRLWNRTVGELARMSAACAIGIVIGAAVFGGKKSQPEDENSKEDATIESVHVNL